MPNMIAKSFFFQLQIIFSAKERDLDACDALLAVSL